MFPGLDVPDLETVADFPCEVIETPTVWIGMSDGVRLAARIWRPATSDRDPVPAILEYIPYRRRDGRLADDERIHPYFAGHGFAALRVDIRGSGDSEGLLLDEYLPLEQDDALEVIDWIAAQPWCSGRVGMMGLSWGGFNSLQVAARAPAPLKAIIAVGATVDRYNDDIHYKNGCLLNENLGWASSLLSFSTRPPDPDVVGARWREMWLERLENLPFFAGNWFVHQARDAYWKHGSVCETYDAIKAPVMTVTGWGDLYVNAVPRLLENLAVPCQALAGPWAHQFPHLSTPGPLPDFLGQALEWWQRWLNGADDGVGAGPVYHGFLKEGSTPKPFATEVPGQWLAASTWPTSDIQGQTWYLGDRTLLRDEADAPKISFRSPVDAGSAFGELVPHCAGPEMAPDQRPDDGQSLVFDSPVLEAPIDIWGDPVFEAALSSDKPTGNLIVRLCDLGPDGASERVSFGVLNLCHHGGNEHPRPLPPNEPVSVRILLDHRAHRFPKGHRIRVALSTASWPAIWPAADNATLTLRPSPARLILPVIQGGTEIHNVSLGPPKAPRPANIETLRPPSNERRVTHDQAQGTTLLEIRDDYGELAFSDNGMINSGIKRERYAIGRDDPLTATAEVYWTQELGRGDWRVRTETVGHLSCDKDSFHLTAQVSAFEGEAQVFEKSWKKSIARS